jgi:hypothetical protein
MFPPHDHESDAVSVANVMAKATTIRILDDRHLWSDVCLAWSVRPLRTGNPVHLPHVIGQRWCMKASVSGTSGGTMSASERMARIGDEQEKQWLVPAIGAGGPGR